ncbi:MAG TPA: Na+/H+ antiporter NhaA [Actinomycetota bacterium]|nr:Na+/H+ antiporter NhaA [Actinomycetota bacterium]
MPRLIARPIRSFLDTEASGGIVLLIATAVALVWVNSPFSETYDSLWSTEMGFRIGSFSVFEDLQHWVNDGLMTIFFFVVGLEIKRELIAGELNDKRKAALPAIAALGGVVVPAIIYALFNSGGIGSSGWGIPMATDIAFAVGLIALLGRRCPPVLKVFLLSLAIVDDIIAILVIAIFYAGDLQFAWLALALVCFVLIDVMRRGRVRWTPAYVIVGFIAWLATLESGVHATISGVVIGLLTPALAFDPKGATDAIGAAGNLADDPNPSDLRATIVQAQEVVPVAERLEHLLHPWTSFLIIPIFALANAGVVLNGKILVEAMSSPITAGIVFGLVLGKIVGITGASWLAVRMRVAELPDDVSWLHVLGVSAVAGIGFTVSLFITELAFDDPTVIAEAKIGILIASAAAVVVGGGLLALSARNAVEETGRPPSSRRVS